MSDHKGRLLRALYDHQPAPESAEGSAAPTATRLTLAALAAYCAALGVLFLFAQDLAAELLAVTVADPTAFRQWGAALAILALLAALLASDPLRYRRLLLVPLVGLPFASVVLVYDLLVGASSLRQLGVPLAINLSLFALLVLCYPRGGGTRGG